MSFLQRLLKALFTTSEEVLAPLCSREKTHEAIVETLNDLGWNYSMRDANTYAAEPDWTQGMVQVVLITLRDDDAVVVSNRNAALTYSWREIDDIKNFIGRFWLCLSRVERR